MSVLEVGAHHTPQEVREIVAWQRYQDEQQRSSRSSDSFKSNLSTKSGRKQKRQMSSENGRRKEEEALYSNSDFHQAPQGM